MNYVTIACDVLDGPHGVALSRDARLLFIEAQAWTTRHVTRGRFSHSALRRLSDSPRLDSAIEELVYVGLWKRIKGGWEIV